jgi:hypothetical protein
MEVLIIAIYNLFLVGGTAYLVALYDWSPWWFILTFLLLANTRSNNER